MSDLAEFLTNHDASLEWLDKIACADMSITDFFVEAGHTINQAVINVCRTCPVRKECLDHAYKHHITGGYFGGVSPGQRRDMSLEKAHAFIAKDCKPVPVTRRRPRKTT